MIESRLVKMYKYKRSPINYMGGKYRSLKNIIPNMPSDIGTFYDIFGGSATVSLNVNAKEYVYNDQITPLSELIELLVTEEPNHIYNNLKRTIKDYQLDTEKGYLKLRKDYNLDKSPIKLFALINYSFNYLMRFNKKMHFNASYGKGICTFSENQSLKLLELSKHFMDKEVQVKNKDFREVIPERLNAGDFIYFDPPYAISQAVYNENRGYTSWTGKDTKEVHNMIRNLNERGVSFGYSDLIKNKGELNQPLINFIEELGLSVIYNEVKYNNLQGVKHVDDKSLEVYITNYVDEELDIFDYL